MRISDISDICANAQILPLIIVENNKAAPRGGGKVNILDPIPLNRKEQKILKKIYKCGEIEVKKLKQSDQSILFSLAHLGLVSDKYRSLTHSQQSQPGVEPEQKFFINETGKRYFIYLRQQLFRFYLPIIISVFALLVSLGTMLVNLFSKINPCA